MFQHKCRHISCTASKPAAVVATGTVRSSPRQHPHRSRDALLGHLELADTASSKLETSDAPSMSEQLIRNAIQI
ncbi:hypothetical protein [Burkholderia sp. LMG 21824]|uniref:hypothetical protein n=1 Tax=Burkholderia sp. LMG 21824 TaxID=3158172 RepID=UPI003C2AE046